MTLLQIVLLYSPFRIPWWLSGKESACNAGDSGSIPGSGKSPEEGHGYPLQYSCLENPMDRRAWRATVCGLQGAGHNWATVTFQFIAHLLCLWPNCRVILRTQVKLLIEKQRWAFLCMIINHYFVSWCYVHHDHILVNVNLTQSMVFNFSGSALDDNMYFEVC